MILLSESRFLPGRERPINTSVYPPWRMTRATRERRLTASELTGRLRALEALAAGKLRPPVLHPDTPLGRKGRPQRQ